VNPSFAGVRYAGGLGFRSALLRTTVGFLGCDPRRPYALNHLRFRGSEGA